MSTQTVIATDQPKEESQRSSTEPLQLRGVLDGYKSFDVTPIIGREFPDVNLKEWLRAPNSDELLRDLAITSMSSKRAESFMADHIESFATRSSFLQETR